MSDDIRIAPVIHSEDLDLAADELVAFARARGEEIRRSQKGVVFSESPKKPEIDYLILEELRVALEDEIVAAAETSDTATAIHQFDVGREVIKKALVGLKLPGLRSIAKSQQVASTGSSEDLATRIAQHYRWNEEEIARLVLENEPEPTTARGHSERLFPLADEFELTDVQKRLEFVVGRYIRIGVARWFVFRELASTQGLLRLRGTVESYQAQVSQEDEVLGLSAIPSESPATIDLTKDEGLVRIRGTAAPAARAAVRALETVTPLRTWDYVPVRREEPLDGAASLFEPHTLFMLDLINTRFRQEGLRELNLTVVRFRMGEDKAAEEDDVARPRLKAVRFDGDHLLDSVVACKLIAEDRRAMVDVSMRVTVVGSEGGLLQFPVRVGLEEDHVFVMTGLGTREVERSSDVHRRAVVAVEEEMKGYGDAPALHELAERIRQRAGEIEGTQAADILEEVEGSPT